MNRPMRRKDRLVSDFDEMVSIASRARQIIIGMVDDGQPYLVPLDLATRSMMVSYLSIAIQLLREEKLI